RSRLGQKGPIPVQFQLIEPLLSLGQSLDWLCGHGREKSGLRASHTGLRWGSVLVGLRLPPITRMRDMCARFQTPSQAAAERYWRLVQSFWRFEASWRVSPTDPVPVVLAQVGQRIGRMMRWDLIPYRNHGMPTGKVLINAKAEHLES